MTAASGKAGRRLEAALAATPEERLRVVLNQALDEALRLYVVNSFSVMMRDKSADPQEAAERAANGIKTAVATWRKAVDAIDRMEVA